MGLLIITVVVKGAGAGFWRQNIARLAAFVAQIPFVGFPKEYMFYKKAPVYTFVQRAELTFWALLSDILGHKLIRG
jgi:hypothetical protein